jgi:HSP20 family molecular chaperone IbpA
MAVPVRRRTRSLLPDLADWFESFPGLPATWARAGIAGAYGIRIEDYTEEGRYVVRAELPGIDPDKNVDITVDEHVLAIHAERAEEEKDKQHCEFRYGSFTRRVPLPVGAKEDEISASYDNGVLTVTVPVEEGAKAGRHIPVQRH